MSRGILRQCKNKTDLAAKIDENTLRTEAGIAKAEEAVAVANGHKSKIVELREEVKSAVEGIKVAKGDR